MLGRILDVLDPETGGDGGGVPTLRHLSYGGGRMPVPTIERALRLLPDVDFVNAYGLTETSSSIAILGPDDHRKRWPASTSARDWVRWAAVADGRDLDLAARMATVPGRWAGRDLVRGEQVSGEYQHANAVDGGWFPPTTGDTSTTTLLVRRGAPRRRHHAGGENLSPGEIEDVLLSIQLFAKPRWWASPDDEWGEAVAAAVVLHDGAHAEPDELADHVVAHLRSSRRPTVVAIRDALPTNDTGKVLRRVLRDDFA